MSEPDRGGPRAWVATSTGRGTASPGRDRARRRAGRLERYRAALAGPGRPGRRRRRLRSDRRPVPAARPLGRDPPAAHRGRARVPRSGRFASREFSARFTGSVLDPATGTVLWQPHRRHPAGPRLDREAPDPSAALHARARRTGSSPGWCRARSPARSCLSAAATRPSPRCPPERRASTRTRRGSPPSRTPAQGGDGDAVRQCWSTPAATAGRPAAGLGPGGPRAGRRPDRAADARRRPQGPRAAGRRRVADPALTAARALAGILSRDYGGASPRAPMRRVPPSSASVGVPAGLGARGAPCCHVGQRPRRGACPRGRVPARCEPSSPARPRQTLVALARRDSTAPARSSWTAADCRAGPGARAAARRGARPAATPAQGARDTESLRTMITGLPVAGGDGTLTDRFAPARGVLGPRGRAGEDRHADRGEQPGGRGRDADGRLLVFALMSNGVIPGLGARAGRDRRRAGPVRLPLPRDARSARPVAPCAMRVGTAGGAHTACRHVAWVGCD